MSTISQAARDAADLCGDCVLWTEMSLHKEQAAALIQQAINTETASLKAEADTMRQRIIEEADSDSIVASCTCHAKTPDIQFHKSGCKYRLISERDTLKAEVEAWKRNEETARANGRELASELERAAATYQDETEDLRARLATAEKERDNSRGYAKALENELRKHSEFGFLFQPGGRFHKEAGLRLGSSCVVEGGKWLISKLDSAQAKLHEIDCLTEGYVDGCGGCSHTSSLCIDINAIIHPPTP